MAPLRRGSSLPPGLAPTTRRYHGGMYRQYKVGYHLETKRAKAAAYCRERPAGCSGQPTCTAVIEALRTRHPHFERGRASAATAQIIARVAQEYADWFWRGAGLPERR